MRILLPAAFLLLSIGLSPLAEAQTQIRFHTTLGNFVVEMSDSLTPITSGNFIDLADSGYYDGVIFHRVISGFVIQGGDPTGTGTGGPGYTIPDEFDSTGTLSNVQRTLSMANAGPNTGGSQFFINLVNNTFLDYDQAPLTSAHPVFGTVIDSFEVVLAIGQTPVNGQNRPLTDVVMDSLRIIEPGDTMTNDTTINDTTMNDTTMNDTAITGLLPVSHHDLQVKVFPNPAGLTSVITVESMTSGMANFMIIDQSGRSVLQFQQPVRKGMNRFTELGLHSETLPVGIYVLRVESAGTSANQRFVIAE